MFRLTEEHERQFREDGYLMVEGLYDDEEMELLLSVGRTDGEKPRSYVQPRIPRAVKASCG